MYLYLLNVSTRNSGAFDVFVLLNPSAYIEIAQVQLPKEIAVKRTPAIVMLFMYLYTYILCVGGGGRGGLWIHFLRNIRFSSDIYILFAPSVPSLILTILCVYLSIKKNASPCFLIISHFYEGTVNQRIIIPFLLLFHSSWSLWISFLCLCFCHFYKWIH